MWNIASRFVGCRAGKLCNVASRFVGCRASKSNRVSRRLLTAVVAFVVGAVVCVRFLAGEHGHTARWAVHGGLDVAGLRHVGCALNQYIWHRIFWEVVYGYAVDGSGSKHRAHLLPVMHHGPIFLTVDN